MIVGYHAPRPSGGRVLYLWAHPAGGRPTESGRAGGIVDPVEHRDRPAPGEDEDGGLPQRRTALSLSLGDEKGWRE